MKGKSKETECFNYIRVLQQLNENVLYVCGTNSFHPLCDHLNIPTFELEGRNEEGKGISPYNPMHSYTSVMVDGELYSGTSFNFLGTESIIFRQSEEKHLKTEYNVQWFYDPIFVSADVVRASEDDTKGEDDKVYFFFTEISVEFQFFGNVLIPRVARVCKGDQGGLKILQRRWSTFLKAALLCRIAEWNYVFNAVNDVFILKSSDLEEPLIYGVFNTQLNNNGVSAVCTYSMSSVEEVFDGGLYFHDVEVENWDIKWARYSGKIPEPRPGACLNDDDRAMNYNSSLDLPDRTLHFAKHHHLMYNPIISLGDKPQLVKQDVSYTKIVVDRVKAVDGSMYNVMFISTDKGSLHKAISSEHGMHIIEEVKLFSDSAPIQTLLLSSKENQRYIYAGSNSGVVQAPVAFCTKHITCVDCVLARDPYCAWDTHEVTCVNILQEGNAEGDLIQEMNGDASPCTSLDRTKDIVVYHMLTPESTAELRCSSKSKFARVVWKFEDEFLSMKNPKYRLLEDALLIFNFKKEDAGVYYCASEEDGPNSVFSQLLIHHIVELKMEPEVNC